MGARVKASGFPQGKAVVSSALSSLHMNEEPAPERMQVSAWNSEVEREVISWKVTVSSEHFRP